MLLPGPSFSRGLQRARQLVFALALLPAGLFAQADEIAGTLPEHHFPALKRILESAVKQSPLAIEKQLDVALAMARTDAANAPRLPRLGGNIRYDNSQTAISSDNSRRDRGGGVFYGIDLGQAVFHWGALKNESARARIGVAIAEKNYHEAFRLLAITLRQSYLELVAKKAALYHARNQQRLREEDLKLERDKFSRGDTSQGSVFVRELAVEEGGIEIQRLEVELDRLTRLLARLAGVPPLRDEDIPLDIPAVAYSPELTAQLVGGLLRDGGRSVFEVQVRQMQVQDAELRYRIARVRLLPKFSLGAGHSVENTTNVTGGTVDQQGVERQSISVRADWSIFDGFATRGAKQEAIAEKRLYERHLATSVEKVLDEAQRLQDTLAAEARATRMADQHRTLAFADLDRVKDEVKLGNLPPYEIEQATDRAYFRTALSVTARARLLAEWSALVSLAGIDPVLKNLPVRYVRPKR